MIGLMDIIIGSTTPSPSMSGCHQLMTMNDYGTYTLNAYSTTKFETIRLCFSPGNGIICRNPRVIMTFLSWDHGNETESEYIEVKYYDFSSLIKTFPRCTDTITGQCDRMATCIDEIIAPEFSTNDEYSFTLQSGYARHPSNCDGKTRMNATVTVVCTESASPSISPSESPTINSIVPTVSQTQTPTQTPTKNTISPSNNTPNPTSNTVFPTRLTQEPSAFTFNPSTLPTVFPTITPTLNPTLSPTSTPTINPTATPTKIPTISPIVGTHSPSKLTSNPSSVPSISPTMNAINITSTTSPESSESPSISLSISPSISPSLSPTQSSNTGLAVEQTQHAHIGRAIIIAVSVTMALCCILVILLSICAYNIGKKRPNNISTRDLASKPKRPPKIIHVPAGSSGQWSDVENDGNDQIYFGGKHSNSRSSELDTVARTTKGQSMSAPTYIYTIYYIYMENI